MTELRPSPSLGADSPGLVSGHAADAPLAFVLFKTVFDVVGSLILIAATLVMGAVLLVLNPFYNPGPLFYVQTRMGRGCKPFRTIKFRTMLPAPVVERGAFDGIERHRITRMGHALRRLRLDELPQGINVLRGQMSMIGPRPDYYEHACVYLDILPRYRDRHGVLPGITGLAQTEVGYAEGIEAVRRKVAADLTYIQRRSIRLDLWIAWRTVQVVLRRQGS
jgi:lipopolysaccharide/colanic/teichoic acid biosynthesis glycosyltransferase